MGLGNTGGNVARHFLNEGFDVVGYDTDEEALTTFEDDGGQTVGLNVELTAEVDVLLSAPSQPEIIEAAYLGDDGYAGELADHDVSFLDVDDLHEALRLGAARRLRSEPLPSAPNRKFTPLFPIRYTQKDLRAAESVDFPMRVTSSILQLYITAAAKGYKDETTSTVLKVFEDWIGERLEAESPVEIPENDPIFGA